MRVQVYCKYWFLTKLTQNRLIVAFNTSEAYTFTDKETYPLKTRKSIYTYLYGLQVLYFVSFLISGYLLDVAAKVFSVILFKKFQSEGDQHTRLNKVALGLMHGSDAQPTSHTGAALELPANSSSAFEVCRQKLSMVDNGGGWNAP